MNAGLLPFPAMRSVGWSSRPSSRCTRGPAVGSSSHPRREVARPCVASLGVVTYNRMVVGVADECADRVFHALADATRRDIVLRTLKAEYSVSALARRYPMSFAAVQKHVAVLEAAGLVTKQRKGREQLVRGNIDTVRTAYRLLEQLEDAWRGRIDRIGEILAAEHLEEKR